VQHDGKAFLGDRASGDNGTLSPGEAPLHDIRFPAGAPTLRSGCWWLVIIGQAARLLRAAELSHKAGERDPDITPGGTRT
jgi:hypothetical protein